MRSKEYLDYIQCLDRICEYYGKYAQPLYGGASSPFGEIAQTHLAKADNTRKTLIQKMEEVIFDEISNALAETPKKEDKKNLLKENKEIKKKKDAKKTKKDSK